MKMLIEEVAKENSGLMALMGKRVMIWCMNYIYSGELIGVNDSDILLKDAHVVYETGELTAKQFKDAQKLPNNWYIRTTAIESYGAI